MAKAKTPVFDRTNTNPRTGLPLRKKDTKRPSFKDFQAAGMKVKVGQSKPKGVKVNVTTGAKRVKRFIRNKPQK